METRLSKNITAGCVRIKNDVLTRSKRSSSIISNELLRKISHIEFYQGELLNRKEKLSAHISLLVEVKGRIQQMIKSLEYPREICLKCIEIRKNIPELKNDAVEKKLHFEVKLISDSQSFFEGMIDKLDEQIRKYRAKIYSLEEEIQRKTIALKTEKTNKHIKITDMDFESEKVVNLNLKQPYVNTQDSDWETDSLEILQSSDLELRVGENLKLHADESLLFKTNALITQSNLCNEAFVKCLAKHKDIKNTLEEKSSNINDEIQKIKQTIRDIEDMIVENEALKKLSEIRLRNRIDSTLSELLRDNVEKALTNEVKDLAEIRSLLSDEWSMTLSTLKTLTAAKNHYETLIHAEMDAIKADEVECLPLRSSMHYHIY